MASDVHSSTNSLHSSKPEQEPIPRGLGLITSVGPGLVLAMSFLGTGDLVSSSVSGASYGYALLWTLVLSLIARTFIISSIAKYTLMNKYGDTQILDGFARLSPALPGIMAAVVLIAGFITQATFVLAASTGLHELTGGEWGGAWGRFFCALIIVALTLTLVMLRKQFTVLEYFARFASVAMIAAFVYALVQIGTFDVSGFFQGLAFAIPEEQNTSAFAPIVIASATIGTIAGNMPNLLYSGFMRDKGWVGPKYRKLQQFDLIVGMAPLLIINLLFWIVAAEFRSGNPGFSISDEYDLSHMLTVAVGPVGPFLLWMCIFFAAMTSFPPQSRGFAQLAINGINHTFPSMRQYLGRDEENPAFRWIQAIVFIIVPLVSTIPGAPDLISLNIVGTAISTVLSLPIIVVCILLLTSRKKHMQTYAVNGIWQTVLLVILGGIAIIIGFQIAMQIPSMFATAFG
ncbi:Nramp family divalent metal transporter [Brevibacterium sp.]|uniref:Nramp family divalent metal transporter n=1 Tax=Brevibacterium sp. TaxID=1701 RepID=UPI002811E650|nr:Nramp family divalent metal transporter [Brevibacterium sp.]